MQNVYITNIRWDTDGDDEVLNELPTEVTIDIADLDVEDPNDLCELSEAISDHLSDKYGFCHYGFETNFDDEMEEI